MAGNSAESGRSVTSKITAILLTLTQGSEHSLTEIARLTRLPVSTAHRLTTELARCGLLDRTADGHYRTAPALRTIETGPGQGQGNAEVPTRVNPRSRTGVDGRRSCWVPPRPPGSAPTPG